MALTRSGDREAFSTLVCRYEERALHTARGILLNLESAREVAQEAFLKVYAFRERFDLPLAHRVPPANWSGIGARKPAVP